MCLNISSVLLIALFCFPTLATSLILNDSKLNQLANSSTWLKLLAYDRELVTGELQASIHSDSFYLYQEGNFTPKKELISTLKGFKASEDIKNANIHSQCLFPARYLWLKRQFDFKKLGIKDISCPNFEKWSMKGDLDSISLIFATGYLGNPASYYGHTLIKLNSSSVKNESLLDVSINYGANIPIDEDPASYIVKGLIGGYEGSFSHSKYYFHTQNYLENELRNIWEYKLNLSKTDQQFLLAHMWELLDKNYIYYFLNKNCVSRMYQLFSLIDGIELPKMNPLWVVPQDAVKALNDAKYKGQDFIKGISHSPSRQALFYDKYWQLSNSEKELLTSIIDNIKLLPKIHENDFTAAQQFRVLGVLIDYYQFLISLTGDEKGELEQKYNLALAERYRLPLGKANFEISKPSSPHLGRPASYTQISWINNDSLGTGIKVRLRPTYYDQLDSSIGHIKNAALKMAEFEFEYFESSFNLSAFTIFDLTSINNQATGLPGDSFDSWKLALGMKKQSLSCTDCLDFTFEGSTGWAYPISSYTTTGIYFGGAIIENYHDRGRFYLSANAFLTSTITDRLNIKLDVKSLKYLENDRESFVNYSIESRYQFNVGKYIFDSRVGLRKKKGAEMYLSLGYYW